jgi:hypothetical protein
MLYLGPNYPKKVGQIAIHNFITPLTQAEKTLDTLVKNEALSQLFVDFLF